MSFGQTNTTVLPDKELFIQRKNGGNDVSFSDGRDDDEFDEDDDCVLTTV